jgi:hypothetical protein
VSVTASVSSSPIAASVSGSSIAASVPASAPVAASVAGGVGPQGPIGPVGPAGSNTLAALTDVQIDAAAAGDVLRYAEGKWRDYPESSVEIDGQNF